MPDLAELANRLQRRRHVLRLDERVLLQELRASATERRIDEAHIAARFKALLETLRDATSAEIIERVGAFEEFPAAWKETLGKPRLKVYRDEDGKPIAIDLRLAPDKSTVESTPSDATTEDEASVQARRAVPLAEHSKDVADKAHAFADAVGLKKLANTIRLAALLHDAGKAEPSFKRWLYGGDELASAAPPLAKSAHVRLGDSARRLAGLPKGARHELASLALAMAHPQVMSLEDPDKELVLWLIGTHHGWGRPFFPPVEWPVATTSFAADLGGGECQSVSVPPLADLLARWMEWRTDLIQRHGHWGLARLESILRLADHRVSEEKGAET